MGQLSLRLQNGVLPLTQLALGGVQLIGGGSLLPLRLCQCLGPIGYPCPDVSQLLVQPLQLVGPAQDTGASAGGAARHRAAGVEHLAVQGDDTKFIAVFSGRGDGGVQILHDRHPSQQVGKYILIFGVEADQLVPHSHEAGLFAQARSLPELSRSDGADGQDGGPAPISPL